MRLRLILVGLYFALMFLCAAATAELVFTSSYMRSHPGWRASQRGARVVVEYVNADGPAALLRAGDEITAFNGQAVKGTSFLNFFELAERDSPYTMEIVRDRERQQLSLRTVSVPFLVRLRIYLATLAIPAIFLLTGLALFVLKPYDKQVLLIALVFGTFGAGTEAIRFAPAWLKALMIAGTIIASFGPAISLHFALIFPEPSRVLRKFPRLEFLLYLPQLLVVAPTTIVANSLSAASAPERLDAFPLAALITISQLIATLYLILGLLVLVLKYRHASQSGRRRVRVLLAGVAAGELPIILINSAQLLFGPFIIHQTLGEWPFIVAQLTLLLVTVSLSYAIVRHQVIPVSLIIRRGLQYLLAKQALRFLIALPVIGLVLHILSNTQRTLDEILLRNSVYFYLLAIAAIVSGLFFRKRLGEWIDRKFFREAYNQDRILSELIEDVKKADSMTEMSRLVSRKVDAALHPRQMYLFYREEQQRDLSLGYSSDGATRELRIPVEFELLRFMEYQSSAQDFPFPLKTNLPQSEKEWLAQLGTRLIVPLTGTDNRLAGLFLLGEKKSEVPYTKTDRQLLETLADQIAIVYENARLKEQVDKDRRIKNEVLARVEERRINLLKECPRCRACFDSSVQVCPTDACELTLSLPVERTIEGRYRLDKLLGKGGMGAVYEATDLRLHRQLAIKILGGSLFGNSEALRRFEREAQTCARLGHAHIITVFDYGVLSTEGAYLAMELVRGETLGAVLKRERHLHTSLAAEWFDQVLEAIAYAHARGVVHRDLKPDNIFISRTEEGRPTVKVLDFGLAKITQPAGADSKRLTAAAAPVTTPGAVMGTFGYMAPEQLMGGEVDERTDLFAIGVIIVEALTGRRPFGGNSFQELLASILHKPFRLEREGPEAARLNQALQRCLAPEPDKRYGSAAEMRSEIIPAIRHCPALAHDDAGVNLDANTVIIKH